VVSFLITIVLAALLRSRPRCPSSGAGGERGRRRVSWISTRRTFQQMLRPRRPRDLAYFAIIIGSFLLLTKASVESVRWR